MVRKNEGYANYPAMSGNHLMWGKIPHHAFDAPQLTAVQLKTDIHGML